jgi:hypothetical protein
MSSEPEPPFFARDHHRGDNESRREGRTSSSRCAGCSRVLEQVMVAESKDRLAVEEANPVEFS